MNIFGLLTIKENTGWIYNDFSLRQSIEKMKYYGFSAMPVVDGTGDYKGIITHTDILKELKKKNIILDKDIEKSYISEIKEIPQRKAIKCTASLDELKKLLTTQNFVPVVDDRNKYIGIVTRRSFIDYLYDFKKENSN